MILVSDTSPLCYLVLIGAIDLVQTRFGEVTITQTVLHELQHPDSPPAVKAWALHLPSWVKVHADPPVDASLRNLEAGEQTAIALATLLAADLICLDDAAARSAALSRGLRVMGVLGFLKEAAELKFIDLPTAIEKLRKTNFRASPALLRQILSA